MKVSKLSEAIYRYGSIDFTSQIWPNQKMWMVMLKIDPTLYPNWYVTGTEYHVHAIYCNQDMMSPLRAALEQVAKNNLSHLLTSFEGCFNIRMVRGNPKSPSAHAYGLAIDINAEQNKLGQESGGLFDHPDLVQCFTDQQFDWGGNFHGRKDPMHFSYCWEHTT